MPTDMTKFKVIYKGIIYNCISIGPNFDGGHYGEDGKYIPPEPNTILTLTVIYLNEDNRIAVLNDNVEAFQFIAK